MANPDLINILIVDDHKIVRDGIISSLKNFENLNVVGEASNGKAVLDLLARKPVDVVLMDISMEDMDGIEATGIIRNNYPDAKILALTMHEDESHIVRMLKAGAMGYILKNVSMDGLIKAIQTVARGEAYFSRKVSDTIMARFVSAKTAKKSTGFDHLTKREKEILKLIAEGLTNHEIAERLFISSRTVDTHRRNLIQKLQVKNTAGLVRMAIKNGIVEA